MNGAQWVVHALRAQGVNTVFGYPVAQLCRFTMHCMTVAWNTCCADTSKVQQWRLSVMPVLPAKLAFASPRLVSATNLITGLADALLDSIPVVAITGQVSAPFIGTDAFQEVDILGLSLACTKHSFRCNHWKSYRVSWPKRLTSPALVVPVRFWSIFQRYPVSQRRSGTVVHHC